MASPLRTALAIAAALAAADASAYGIGEVGDRRFQQILYSIPAAIEVAIPDVRLEYDPAGRATVLSWPLHFRLFGAGGVRQTEHTTLAAPRAELTLFAEPQVSLRPTHAYRGLLGTRGFGGLPLGGALLALIAEGGGLVATDGHGAFAGVGLGFGALMDRNFPYLALVARHVWTTAGTRVDFAIDFLLPFPIR